MRLVGLALPNGGSEGLAATYNWSGREEGASGKKKQLQLKANAGT